MLNTLSNLYWSRPLANTFAKRTCLCGVLIFAAASMLLAPASANAQIFSNWFSSDDQNKQNELDSETENLTLPLKTDKQKHQAAFGELVYLYFQEDYQDVLTLIEVGNKVHQFALLEQDNIDRLNLLQGASQLQLGLYKQAQAKFASLLSQTTSDYVQANTWFFMAKAGFENKQAYLTERAYAAIQQGDLRENLSAEQWYELIYLTAYTRMQLAVNEYLQGAEAGQSVNIPSTNLDSDDIGEVKANSSQIPSKWDWQSLHAQIPKQNIYHAYLLANHATNLFNAGDYELATNTFADAKQALIAYQNRRGFIRKIASSMFDSVSWFVTPWTWFDENSTAQQLAEEREQSQDKTEQDALFDRINVGLGQSLLQQGDLENAIAVIQNIAEAGGESEQALLTYGWANARENRWQTAMAAWQHLQNNSVGLFALQASYGLAYAFSQQDNLGQAFFALRNTAQQIDASLIALDAFANTSQSDEFFSQYNDQWPDTLSDLKLGFFAPTQNFDAQYLLSMRQQAKVILKDIDAKSSRLNQLTQMLYERQQAYQDRSNSLSLARAQEQINQTQAIISQLNQVLNMGETRDQSDNQEDRYVAQLALSKRMASTEISDHLSRLERANERHTRLQNDTTRKRPLRASYQERLRRIEGIISWQLMDDFVAKKWQHQVLLKDAQAALLQTQTQYERLKTIQQQKDAFSDQRAELSAMLNELSVQTGAANNVYAQATDALRAHLLNLIATRKAQLQQQSVNTRLAMLRIQDLRQPGGR